MPLSDYKVLSFACYGTLINRDSGIYNSLRPLLARSEPGLDREQTLAKFAEYEARQQAETPRMPYPQLLAEVHRQLAKEWGVLASDDDHAWFGQSTANWPIYADAPAALQYLKRFFKLVVLSNVDRQTFALGNLRLDAKFDAIFTGPELGRCKPDPGLFEHLAERFAKQGVERRQILHVAHSLPRDQLPAARCGIAFAWIERPGAVAGTEAYPGGDAERPAWQHRFPSLVDMVKAHQQR